MRSELEREARDAMKVLHLEDNQHDSILIGRVLKTEWPECDITVVARREDCVAALRRDRFDLILSDFTLIAFNGLEALALAKECAPDTPFIFISGTIGEDRAIEAVRSGADDYVLKDKIRRLTPVIRRSLREREERKLREDAERRLREQAAILNQAHDVIIITDLDRRITYWNVGAENLIGWKAEEVLGRDADEICGGEARDQIAAARLVTERNGAWRGEVTLENREGRPLVLETRRTLIRDAAGRPKAHLSISTDVTDRKRLEEQLLRSQRMENIGLLAAGIAHDLNNILAPILMAAPMLKERVTETADRNLLNMLERSAQRGAGLVRQILAFANGAVGQKKVLHLKHLIHEISIVVGETFPKNIRFEERVAADTRPVAANATQIHQVLLNLCVNARDAMVKGGTLRIAAENFELDAGAAEAIEGARAGTYVLVRVEDTGSGIPPEVVARMWEPFYTTKERGKGTGLGLSTVRGIMESHGGFVEVRTAQNVGTTFRLYLPAAEAAVDPANGVPEAQPPRGQEELILVVDDERHVLDLAAKLLASAGYDVVTARDGREALEIFRTNPRIELIVSDTQMPNMDGPSLARAVRSLRPEVCILAMSGLSLDKAKEGSEVDFRGYADHFLRKPFRPDALLEAVHDLLHARQI